MCTRKHWNLCSTKLSVHRSKVYDRFGSSQDSWEVSFESVNEIRKIITCSEMRPIHHITKRKLDAHYIINLSGNAQYKCNWLQYPQKLVQPVHRIWVLNRMLAMFTEFQSSSCRRRRFIMFITTRKIIFRVSERCTCRAGKLAAVELEVIYNFNY